MSDITDTNPATEDVIDAVEDAVDTSTAEATEAVDEVAAVEEAAADEVTEDTSAAIDEVGDQAESDDAASDDTASDDTAADDTSSDDTASDEEASDDDASADHSADEAEEEAPARRRRDSPYDRPGRWYVIHTQSGYENKVRSNLLARTQSMNMEERIFEVVIPLEDVVEFKNGKKVIVQKKVFPGYLLTRMHA